MAESGFKHEAYEISRNPEKGIGAKMLGLRDSLRRVRFAVGMAIVLSLPPRYNESRIEDVNPMSQPKPDAGLFKQTDQSSGNPSK